MKYILMTFCSLALVGAVVFSVGCPVLKMGDVPCESSYDCPAGYGCGDREICVSNLGESVLTVSPAQIDVAVSNSQAFTATIDGRTADVDWALDPSDPSMGAIDSSGLYVAPSALPSPDLVTVQASLKRHTELRASATLHLVPAQPDGGNGGVDAGPVPTNQVPDPGFESATATEWVSLGGTPLGADAKTTTNPHSGLRCLCLYGSQRTQNWQGPLLDITNLVDSGTFTFSAWARTGATDAGSTTTTIAATMTTACTGVNDSILLAEARNAPANQWVPLVGTVVVPPCVVSNPHNDTVKLSVYISGPPAGVDECLDDVILLKDR
jgi:hypothetical protein